MDIESQLERYLNEGRDDMGAAQLGKRLFQRYKSTKDVEDKVDTLFLLNILVLSMLTKDKTLMNKSRTKL
jgi:hypothetical protein